MTAAITGLGALTPIGNGLEALTDGLRDGRNGVGPIAGFDASRHRVRRAAEVCWTKPPASPYSRATEMALAVTSDAIADAGLDRRALARLRTSIVLVSNQGGMAASAPRYREITAPYRQGRPAAPLVPRMLDGAPVSTLDLLMLAIGSTGSCLNISTACSAGLHALGIAFDALAQAQADLVIVVGVEVLTEPALAGFSVLRALTESDGPRPFDRRRDGTLLGEGAAAIVVEAPGRALARGAPVWAEIAGYGSSTDAYHMTRPQAEGAARAATDALGDCAAERISWVKTHGTGTPANDLAEARALHQVFGSRVGRLPVTALKATLGHSLGASGVVEAVATVMAMAGGFVPPTLNIDSVDPECDLDVVRGRSRPLQADAVLANAFGFGGNNAAMLFTRPAGQQGRVLA
jgi:3-oxoacyl-[acyl-carrier-protein] synthase II